MPSDASLGGARGIKMASSSDEWEIQSQSTFSGSLGTTSDDEGPETCCSDLRSGDPTLGVHRELRAGALGPSLPLLMSYPTSTLKQH